MNVWCCSPKLKGRLIGPKMTLDAVPRPYSRRLILSTRLDSTSKAGYDEDSVVEMVGGDVEFATLSYSMLCKLCSVYS